jgi:hypothetical protein
MSEHELILNSVHCIRMTVIQVLPGCMTSSFSLVGALSDNLNPMGFALCAGFAHLAVIPVTKADFFYLVG